MSSLRQGRVREADSRSALSALPESNRPGIAALPFTVTVGAFWLLLVDAPRLIKLGPVTLAGAFTLLIACLTICLLPGYVLRSAVQIQTPGGAPAPSSRIPWAMWGYVLFVLGSFTLTALDVGISSESVQNACVYVLFVGAIAFAAAAKSLALVSRAWDLMRNLSTWFAYIALVISGVERILYPGSVDNSRFIFTPRSMAMVGLIALAVVIPGTPRNSWVKYAPFALVAAMALTLSRTSTVIGLAMLVFFVLRGKRAAAGKPGGRLFKGLLMFGAVALSAYALIVYYTPFRERFIGGDNAWDFGEVSISTQGRARVWELLLSNSYDSWLFGHGAGSASQLVGELTRLNHPHNEYLRLYFDFGIVGLSLFVVGYVLLAWRILRNARRTDHPLHWAAFIALIAIALVAVTDNPFVYAFIMIPLGSLAGLSLALSGFELSDPQPSQRSTMQAVGSDPLHPVVTI